MKVYGYDISGPARGELLAANIDPADWKMFGLDQIAGSLGWEYASTRFLAAKAVLVTAMRSDAVDPELIKGVQDLKAWMVPVVEDEE